MKRFLEPISLHGGVVAADEERHTLSLSGSPQEVAALKDAIAAFDTDTMRGMTFMFVPVTSSDPDTMAEELRNVFGSSKDGPMGGMLRFIANRRLSGILVISSQPQYLERARAWIHRLDTRAQDNEKQFFSYRVKNRPAKELLKIVNAMFGGSEGRGSSVSPRNGVAAIAPDSGAEPGGAGEKHGFRRIGGQTGLGRELGNANGAMAVGGSPTGAAPGSAPPGPNGGPLSSGGAFGGSASASNGQAALGDDSRFKLAVDDAKNALVIMASPSDYKRLMRVIQALDVAAQPSFHRGHDRRGDPQRPSQFRRAMVLPASHKLSRLVQRRQHAQPRQRQSGKQSARRRRRQRLSPASPMRCARAVRWRR